MWSNRAHLLIVKSPKPRYHSVNSVGSYFVSRRNRQCLHWLAIWAFCSMFSKKAGLQGLQASSEMPPRPFNVRLPDRPSLLCALCAIRPRQSTRPSHHSRPQSCPRRGGSPWTQNCHRESVVATASTTLPFFTRLPRRASRRLTSKHRDSLHDPTSTDCLPLQIRPVPCPFRPRGGETASPQDGSLHHPTRVSAIPVLLHRSSQSR